MNTRDAHHIAEHLWEDIAQEGSVFDVMMKIGPSLEEMRLAGKDAQVRDIVIQTREELIAHWTLLIIEVSKHNNEEGGIAA